MYCLKNILVIFFALLMRSSLGLELMVNDSIVLNSLIPTLLGETKEGLIQTKVHYFLWHIKLGKLNLEFI
jgi:hypothetical protein